MSHTSDDLFELHSLQAAKVSEISESTASSAVEPADRVNFHIGNPVQDPRLFSAYRRLVFQEETSTSDTEPIRSFLTDVIREKVSYAPRGGYPRGKPSGLIKRLMKWLSADQPEPLSYDFGESSGIREGTISSGGMPVTSIGSPSGVLSRSLGSPSQN